jgi:hypothetical protein
MISANFYLSIKQQFKNILELKMLVFGAWLLFFEPFRRIYIFGYSDFHRDKAFRSSRAADHVFSVVRKPGKRGLPAVVNRPFPVNRTGC